MRDCQWKKGRPKTTLLNLCEALRKVTLRLSIPVVGASVPHGGGFNI